MSYGKLIPEQWRLLEPYVKGVTVHDLGAGTLELSHALVDHGARGVLAIDRDQYHLTTPKAGIVFVKKNFKDYDGPIDVAFVSWPRTNYRHDGLDVLCARARIVIYLGKNMDGVVCGTRDFWDELTQREVLAHYPDPLNTLIVYGPDRLERRLLPEEEAARNEVFHVYYQDVFPC